MVTQNNKTRKFRNVIMTAAAVLAIGGAMARHIEKSPKDIRKFHPTSVPVQLANGNWSVTGTDITGTEKDEDYSCSSGSGFCTVSGNVLSSSGSTYVLSNSSFTSETGTYSD